MGRIEGGGVGMRGEVSLIWEDANVWTGWNCYLSYLNSGGGKLPNLPIGQDKEGGELPPS